MALIIVAVTYVTFVWDMKTTLQHEDKIQRFSLKIKG